MQVKLINLNVWLGGKNLWENIVEFLKNENPDILMIQEAFAKTDTDIPYFQTAKSLQKILGHQFSEQAIECILSNGEVSASPVTNAILSKFPLENKHIEWVHGSEPKEVDDREKTTIANFPRNLLHCQCKINDKIYNLMVTHGVWAFDHIETENQKAMGKKISSYMEGKENVILSGDFNVNENTETIASIEKKLVNIFKGQRSSSFNMKQKTEPGYAKAVVDFVFSSPNIKILSQYSPDVNVSDHQTQVVIFDL